MDQDNKPGKSSKSLVWFIFFIIIILVLLFFLRPFGKQEVLYEKSTPTGQVEVIQEGDRIDIDATSTEKDR